MGWLLNKNLISYDFGNHIWFPKWSDIRQSQGGLPIVHDGVEIESLENSLNIRISSIGAVPQLSIVKTDSEYFVNASVSRRGKTAKVGILNGQFVDYAIVNNIVYYLTDPYENLQAILKDINIAEPLSLAKCLALIKEFEKARIPLNNNVSDEINHHKTEVTESHADGLKANLFPYQKCGSSWMSFMINNGCGCILGDEMGLGKTLQIIAVLGEYKQKHKEAHFLVCCPVSLLENWRREIAKFYPTLSVIVHHGSHRTGYYKDLSTYDVTIVSYSNLTTDFSMLNMIPWDIMVIDEAQNIKNPRAQRTLTTKALNKRIAIAVTGTPFENHLTDVWSITDFVLPSYLGSIAEFESAFEDSQVSAAELEDKISPILLRRKVEDVAQDLPAKVIIPHPIMMADTEALYYENGLIGIQHDALSQKKLSVIQKLRMFCTHPFVYDPSLRKGNNPTICSQKYNLLCNILEEIFSNREKGVVFTSFNEMNSLIVDDCSQRFKVATFCINGNTPPEKRQAIIDEFTQVKGSALMVLNPKAAGAGLNITAANHVIHYNLEWNPAIEDQASARCYRRGQNKTVFIHRLFYVNTIEDFINEKIYNKREIFSAIVVGNDGASTTQDVIDQILGYSPLAN